MFYRPLEVSVRKLRSVSHLSSIVSFSPSRTSFFGIFLFPVQSNFSTPISYRTITKTMSTLSSVPTTSSSSSSASSSTATASTLPSHHASKGGFQNPPEWNSYVEHGFTDFFTKALPEWRRTKVYALPTETVNWEAIRNPVTTLMATKTTIQSLWIGHVTFLLQSNQGLNILTDPVFSNYASPVNYVGPARYTPAPCTISDLPPIHIVLISHNHYDHVDSASIRSLVEKERRDLNTPPPTDSTISNKECAPYTGTHYYCPLGVGYLLESFGVRPEKITELDWGQDKIFSVPKTNDRSSTEGVAAAAPLATLSCVPAQHQSARTIFDRNSSLWCGWVITLHNTVDELSNSNTSTIYFSGDTGYRSVEKGTLPYSDEEKNAVKCPIFRQLGERFGSIDLGLLPIGAYSPRGFMSSFHTSPEDAVEIHMEIKAKKSIGMHWGTFLLTDEPIEEPPQRLEEAVRRKGLEKDTFVAVKPGAITRV